MPQEISKYFIEILPSIFWVLLFLLVIWFVSKWLGKLTAAFLNKTRLNQALRDMGLEGSLFRIDTQLNAPKFFGEIVRWFFFILFLALIVDSLGMAFLSQFLWRIIDYYPNIFIAALIFLVAVFLADFSQKIVVGTLEKEKITYSRFSGRVIRWAVWLFAILAILYQLKIAPSLILVIFIGVVFAISIALGISFGLGGKSLASKILKELEEKFK